MAVKLELYRVFHEVARMGNISAAAQNLFISQSAVSQSIKQLEEQLQVRLFSRSTKGVYLTSEGKLLQEYMFPRAGADSERGGEAGAVAAAFDGRVDHWGQRHGDEDVSSVPA